jgi:nitrate reductase gamma subunit
MSANGPAISRTVPPLLAAGGLLAAGLVGGIGAAWGYGLFMLAMALLALGAGAFAVYAFTRSGDGATLQGVWSAALKWGAWGYVWAVAALSGHFIHETLVGRMELAWILFGPAALAAIVAVDWGLYKLLVKKNLPTWGRFGHLVTRDAIDPAAMRRTFVDDVVLHKSLFSVSRFRWLRHTLIFWGFVAMFGVELLAVLVREAWPAFGGHDVWRVPGHPLRLGFDFAYDFTGAMILAGCLLALVWRVLVNGKPEQKFADTPSTLFLLFVVASGFILEALRLATMTPDPSHWASFLGYALSFSMPAGGIDATLTQALWYIHVFGSCAFIAYVPAKRLVHSCATPVGRLMNSQKGLLARKRLASLGGLMTGNGND